MKTMYFSKNLEMLVIVVLGAFLALTLNVSCFNIENRNYTLKSNDQPGSYFGFSVALHKEEPGEFGNNWLLVGAPLGKNLQPDTNRSGALFKCPLDGGEKNCLQVVTDGLRVDDFGSDDGQLFPPGKDEIKEDQWMGVAVKSQGPGGKVVVCAHRYIHSENIEHHHNGFGLCYLLDNTLHLEEDLQPCKGKPVERMHQQFGVCQAGTSLDVLDNGIALMGAPGPYTWRGTIFSKTVVGDFIDKDANTYMGPLNETSEPIDKYSYLGMSVTGGRFINQEMLYAAGAPRSNFTGQVYFFRQLKDNTQLNIIKIINGFDFASSFGYEILAEDINNDGHDDLIVAAPFYYDEKHGGQIYVYLNLSQCLSNPDVECHYSQKIAGKQFSRFGFALTSLGDINKDGYNDVAVGAPYETWSNSNDQTGAVYVYLGSKDGLVTKESQVLTEKRVKTFGYSLSGGLDMDNNGYPDLLVGAYETDVAIFYKTRPIIDIKISITGNEMKNIDASKKGCFEDPNSNHTCFSFKVCLSFDGATNTRSFNVNYNLEESTKSQRKRVFWKSINNNNNHMQKDYKQHRVLTIDNVQGVYCNSETVYVEQHVRDFLLPMQFVLNCSLTDTSPHSNILNRTSVTSFSATFQKDCGADDVCTSALELEAAPSSLSPRENMLNNTPVYVVESIRDELHLKVRVVNHGEPGYEAKLYVEYPEELSYIALKSSTGHIQCNSRNQTVSCDLGNPMNHKQKETAILRFEIYRRTKPELLVKVHVNTTSTDKSKHSRKQFFIVLEKRAKFTLSSKRTTNLYFGGDKIRGESQMRGVEDIGPRVTHLFSLENTGKWALTNFNVTILWPYQIYTGTSAHGKWLLYLEDLPKVIGTNRAGFCTIDKPSLINPLTLSGVDLDEPENLIDAKTRLRRSVNGRWKRDVDAVIEPKRKTVQDKTYNVVEFNCFSNSAKCAIITCTIPDLAPDGQLNIHVKSRLWNSTLTEDYNGVDWISIASYANVSVSSEFTLDNQTSIYTTSETIVYAVPPQSVNYWWIIAAVICGLIVLIIIIFILYKCGFFKRNRVAKDKTLTGNLIPKEESKELLHH